MITLTVATRVAGKARAVIASYCVGAVLWAGISTLIDIYNIIIIKGQSQHDYNELYNYVT